MCEGCIAIEAYRSDSNIKIVVYSLPKIKIEASSNEDDIKITSCSVSKIDIQSHIIDSLIALNVSYLCNNTILAQNYSSPLTFVCSLLCDLESESSESYLKIIPTEITIPLDGSTVCVSVLSNTFWELYGD